MTSAKDDVLGEKADGQLLRTRGSSLKTQGAGRGESE